ncbi:FG-GAP-like repeat-containing protein [Ideonella sp. BN130291]|uniref:FG-GAP-like repeat-containing protein n=1 Tax=Ideonella sp. BN130291 TaxID=3112940 RepID=UPI002E25419E|nr:FG-GAP-like repeat-containing protein [Ideonella sp. BN130291]
MAVGVAAASSANAQTATKVSSSVGPTGAFTLSIPLRVPPGAAGAQPGIALSYNSQSGNGVAGMGWTVTGLSMITRCPAIRAIDGFSGGVNLDGDDRLCLDGQRLIYQSGGGGYGTPGAAYVTEVFNGSKVVQLSGAPSSNTNVLTAAYAGPTVGTSKRLGYNPGSGTGIATIQSVTPSSSSTFVVYTKGGETIEYVPAEVGPSSSDGFYRQRLWLAWRVSDAKGNYWAVSYTHDEANGEFLPQTISYTLNDTAGPTQPYNFVDFVYEDRPDISAGYIAGQKVSGTKRLKTIRTRATASGKTTSNIATEYRLTYGAQSTATGRSLLASVTECGFENDTTPSCLNPVRFEYENPAVPTLRLKGSGSWPSGGEVYYLADFNGDGRTDAHVQAWQGGWTLFKGGPAGLESTISTGSWPADGEKDKITVGDFDGDGKPDIFVIALNGGWKMFLNKGNGIGTAADASGPYPSKLERIYPGDFDGDGKTDLYVINNNGGWGIWKWNGSTFAQTGSGSWPSTLETVYLGDFNGDGRTDVFAIANEGGWKLFFGTKAGSISATADWSGSWPSTGERGKIFVGDYNGDGKSDLFVIALNGGYKVLLSTGKAFVDGSAGPWPSNLENFAVGDFNGDGLADILVMPNDESGWQLWYGSSTGVFKPTWAPNGGDPTKRERIYVGDFDGDGKADVLAITGSSGWRFYQGDGAYQGDRLSAYITSLGLRTSLSYMQLGSTQAAGRFTKDVSVAYPRTTAVPPATVVKTVTADNAFGGRNTSDYFYGAAIGHLDGRGFAGFNYVRTVEGITGNTQTTWFNSAWPLIGRPAATLLQTASLQPVSRTDMTYAAFDGPYGACTQTCTAGRACVVNQGTNKVKAWELNGALLPQTETTMTYDCFGNALVVNSVIRNGTNYTDSTGNAPDGAATGYKTTTTSEYWNDEPNWFIGRAKKTTVTKERPAN